MTLIKSVVIIISFSLVSLIEFDHSDAQEQNSTNASTNTSALMEKGTALQKLGNNNESIVYYDRVLDIDPNDVGALSNKGLALYHLGQYEKQLDIMIRY